ncbi:hypothetical protein IV203_013957 [Nitzschia inconspicua]|uniref:Uncharacterized protein n=1 Tax=Nitzschia inconspicua TaxID=303405 RepID=A0A9K3Q7V1_9STRA|nr:hypothetical protein IV203_013957 [Nitzschia inconspicua]
MAVVVQWSGLYLQCSSFNFLMSGLFGDILCLRFFLTFAYLFLFINAVTGYPALGELVTSPTENFLLHWDVLAWSTITLYVHFSKFLGILLNEKEIHLPGEAMPLWRMLYRNGGISQLLFKQFIYPQKFQLVKFKAGSQIPVDNCLYIILDGVADTQITLQRGDGYTNITPKSSFADLATARPKKFEKSASAASMTQRSLALTSGDMINIKTLQLFRSGSESEAFANQTVHATAVTDMTLYRIRDVDLRTMARTPQTKNAYQGLLIFALTGVAEREIMVRHFSDCGDYSEYNTHRELGPDGRDLSFQPLEAWEEPNPLISGSGKALTMPVRHFLRALQTSFRPPWPIIRWIPGLRHAALPAPHLCPPEETLLTRKDTISSLTNDYDAPSNTATTATTTGDKHDKSNDNGGTTINETTPLMVVDPSSAGGSARADPTGMEVSDGSAMDPDHATTTASSSSGDGGGGGGLFWFFGAGRK